MVGPVCVTGASGFLAGEIIKQLFQRGFTEVRGTVRDVSRYKFLTDLYPALQLSPADLLIEGSFDNAVAGCEIVFHTASPFFFVTENPLKDLVEPALHGTVNVLKSVDRAGTVKRVVLTSSVAAVAGKSKMKDGYFFTEQDWNTDGTIETEAYRYSKYVAEKAAWEINAGKPWKLVTICPTFVLGPPHYSRADATSIKTIQAFLNGEKKESGVGPSCVGIVDVRDAARAHIEAAVREGASGRYIVTSPIAYTHFELSQILARHPVLGKYPLPTHEIAPVLYKMQFDTRKARDELGFDPAPNFVEKAVIDMAFALISLGIVKEL